MLNKIISKPLDSGNDYFLPSSIQIPTFDIGNSAVNVIPETAKASIDLGMRLCTGGIFIDLPGVGNRNHNQYLNEAIDFCSTFKNSNMIFPAVMPHGAYTVKPDHLKDAKKIANEYEAIFSTHAAERNRFTDSMMLDYQGNIAEATGANIFFKDKNGEIHTPIPDSFLDGITRRTVIGIAKSKNIKVHERKISPTELPNFVGCFLTGTAAEVTPVSCIAENQFKVCDTIIDLNESYQTLVRKKKAA